ncbi:hypothetical protein BT96DRAFT_949317 [Gymnopus androsaceus JB14]|uniref:Uncharacterized protein n=1 Tax=Gymnopus androsaceus JB14 TaxID=1447944 RepID=A0A6A4GKU9_9AGAR|nr:hypothetical protein BT96DRAFT_949317 [Gymnopus androsaceus JB14]
MTKHLKPGARYIQKILSTSSDTGNIIVLMLPGLAELLHEAQTTLHDNTYKGVSGDWKEWEVVVWDALGSYFLVPVGKGGNITGPSMLGDAGNMTHPSLVGNHSSKILCHP